MAEQSRDPSFIILMVVALASLSLEAAAQDAPPSLTDLPSFSEVTLDDIAFIKIPTASFPMGTTDAQRQALNERGLWSPLYAYEQPEHPVAFTQPFLIGKYEVTQKQWKAVMGDDNNPSAFKGDSLPVDSVSWHLAQEFIRKLNEKSGDGYRLPTEAEWEFCARTGGAYLYGLGDDGQPLTTDTLQDHAWFRANADNRTRAVGSRRSNAWRLHDLYGNVWEWCQDFYHSDFYERSPLYDPLCREPSTERVFRGGSWFLEAVHLRSSFRSGNLPHFKSPYVGFRLVREVE